MHEILFSTLNQTAGLSPTEKIGCDLHGHDDVSSISIFTSYDITRINCLSTVLAGPELGAAEVPLRAPNIPLPRKQLALSVPP